MILLRGTVPRNFLVAGDASPVSPAAPTPRCAVNLNILKLETDLLYVPSEMVDLTLLLFWPASTQ